jgi:hypothetical protein
MAEPLDRGPETGGSPSPDSDGSGDSLSEDDLDIETLVSANASPGSGSSSAIGPVSSPLAWHRDRVTALRDHLVVAALRS